MRSKFILLHKYREAEHVHDKFKYNTKNFLGTVKRECGDYKLLCRPNSAQGRAV